jgi:hypothetical protein
VHEADGPQEPDQEREQGEHRFLHPANHPDRQCADEDERQRRALEIPALHQPGRLVRDDGRAGDLGIDLPEVAHELLGALALPDVHVRVDLEEEAPVLPHELSAEVGRDVLDRDRAWVQVALQAVELRHEIPVELRLEVAQRGFGRLAVDGLESPD